MKITYRVNKTAISKKQPLEGIRKANEPTKEQIEKKKVERLKRFDPSRVLLTSILLFLLEVLVLYLINFPIVRLSLDYFRTPSWKLPTVSYNTIKLKLGAGLSEATKNDIKTKLGELAFNGTKRFDFVDDNADVTLSYTAEKPTETQNLGEYFLLPVGHLYWIRDSVALGNLQQDEILIPQGTKTLYDEILGKYLGKSPNTKETPNLLSSLKSQEKSVGFVSADDINAQYKLLSLDGQYFYDNAPKGALPYYLAMTGKSDVGMRIVRARAASVFPESFDANSILSVRMTGVTAITRGLGMKTNASGDPSYAARKIGDFLSKADLTHVSNEISMVNGCVPAGGVSFCMVPSHIAALKKSGVDIVELTGNHNNDKGAKYNTSTINTYKSLGWDYFGGGLNATDASRILYKELKGSKVAFLGYNVYDTIYHNPEIATSSHAGSNSWSPSKITRDVAEARKNGADVVIVDLQYQECWSYTEDGSTVQQCYGPIGSPDQKKDFRQAADAGADIVIGTQAHQVQTYEVYKGKVIFYGLGNLYFDQTEQLGTRQGLILTHYLYKGKYLGTGITTTIYDNDLLTYITTGSQRTSLLKSLQVWRPK